MKATAQIFLSYAREDAKKVENLYQKLSDAGFKPWMDKKDILPGEQWKSRISQAIRSSDFFLVCLSAHSVDKRGLIQKEIKEALDIWQEMLDSDIYLIPVRLEDCEAPEGLRNFQWANLFEEGGWTRLVKAIQVGMERRAEVPSDEEPPPGTGIAPEEGSERVPMAPKAGELVVQPPSVEPAVSERTLMPLDIGDFLQDRYKIKEVVKEKEHPRTRFSAVYHAYDNTDKKEVVIKALATCPPDASSADLKTYKEEEPRFNQEIRALNDIRDPNITELYSTFRQGNVRYMALGYLHDRYTIKEVLKGHRRTVFSAVYRVYDRVMKRELVIKALASCPPGAFSADLQAYKQEEARFNRELEALNDIRDSNVVISYDTFQKGDVRYMVLEYLRGGTLEDLLMTCKEKKLEWRTVRRLGLEICHGLRAIHSTDEGWAHLDIKPPNIFLRGAISQTSET